MYGYTLKMTKAYPGDVRIFVSRIIPILMKFYGYPTDFDKKELFDSFSWREMYDRNEWGIIGKKEQPYIEIYRGVFGNFHHTDEYESSTIKAINFCPPYIKDSLFLEIECSESFYTPDIGSHSAKVFFRTDAALLYEAVVTAIETIVKQFKNAELKVFRCRKLEK